MRLSVQPPRRFSTRSSPDYPALLAAGALLAATACKPASNGGEASIAPDPTTATAKPQASASEPLTPAAQGEPAHFAVDDDPLDVRNVSCKGDCPSPFQIASSRKDVAQVQARADWCVRAAEHGAGGAPATPVPAATATLRGTVDKSGKASELVFEPKGALPPAIAECVLGLVRDATLTPPERGGTTRGVYAQIRTKAK